MPFFEHNRIKIDIINISHIHNKCKITTSGTHSIAHSTSQLPYYELFYKEKSDITFHYNGTAAKPDSCIVGFLPHAATNIVNPPVKEFWTEYSHKSESSFIKFTCDSLLSDTAQAEFYDCTDFAAEIKPIFYQVEELLRRQETGYRNKTKSLFYKILAILQKNFSSSCVSQTEYKLIRKSIEYLEEHYLDKDFRCSDLAVISNITTSHYNDIFSQVFGMTPKKYVLDKKLTLACDLLLDDYSVSETAEKTGFLSLDHFSRIFKKHFNIPPRDYKSHYLGKYDV